MSQAEIVVKGLDSLALFIDLVEAFKKPNVKASVIIEGRKGIAFLISPELNLEIKTA